MFGFSRLTAPLQIDVGQIYGQTDALDRSIIPLLKMRVPPPLVSFPESGWNDHFETPVDYPPFTREFLLSIW